MTPAQEAAYLRTLADDIATDERSGHTARTVTATILDARATRIEVGA